MVIRKCIVILFDVGSHLQNCYPSFDVCIVWVAVQLLPILLTLLFGCRLSLISLYINVYRLSMPLNITIQVLTEVFLCVSAVSASWFQFVHRHLLLANF
jgi:hypothetical protein